MQAGVARLVMAAGGGWLAIQWFEGGLPALFTAVAAGLVVYDTIGGNEQMPMLLHHEIPRPPA